MDITSFIPSQRQAILERFQQVEALSLGAIRIELKVANPVGIIYECYIMVGENYFSDQAVVSFRILYEKDLERISLDVVDIPGRSSLSNYLQLLEIFEGLQNYLNREFAKVKIHKHLIAIRCFFLYQKFKISQSFFHKIV